MTQLSADSCCNGITRIKLVILALKAPKQQTTKLRLQIIKNVLTKLCLIQNSETLG